MNNTITLCGTEFEVERYVKPNNSGNLKTVPFNTAGATPTANIPMMSDYKWQKRCLEDRLNHPEKYADRENLPETIARLRKWLAEHEPT